MHIDAVSGGAAATGAVHERARNSCCAACRSWSEWECTDGPRANKQLGRAGSQTSLAAGHTDGARHPHLCKHLARRTRLAPLRVELLVLPCQLLL